MTTDTQSQPDLLYGVHAIADYLGIKKRAAQHLVETGRIPAFKIGKTVCARRSTVRAALETMEQDSPKSARRYDESPP